MGAYENPKLIVQDHLAFQRAFDAKMQPALESYAKAVEAKKLREEEAERLLQQRIDVTTAGLYGTIENLGRSSQATKDNIKNNVNDFVMYAQENKLTANRLLEFKNNWKNSTDPYNDLLNQSISGNVNISKGHEHYDEYIEMVTAVKNGAIFDNKFNRDTGNFEGVLTYQVNGKTVTKSAEQINIVLNGVAGAAEELASNAKTYNDMVKDDKSVVRTLINNELDKIFNTSGGTRSATDEEFDTILNNSFEIISRDKGLMRHIWYNEMSEADKIISYTDANGKEQSLTIDWKVTDEHFYNIADANNDGKLSKEEAKVQKALVNSRERLVKKYVTDLVKFGADSRRVRLSNSIDKDKKFIQDKASVQFIRETLRSIKLELIDDPSKMGPEEFNNILFTKYDNDLAIFPNNDVRNAPAEKKRQGYLIWLVQKLNDVSNNKGSTTLQWYTSDQLFGKYKADMKAMDPDLTDEEIEKMWLKSDTYRRKVTAGPGKIFYTRKGMDYVSVLQEMTYEAMENVIFPNRGLEDVATIMKNSNTTPPLN